MHYGDWKKSQLDVIPKRLPNAQWEEKKKILKYFFIGYSDWLIHYKIFMFFFVLLFSHFIYFIFREMFRYTIKEPDDLRWEWEIYLVNVMLQTALLLLHMIMYMYSRYNKSIKNEPIEQKQKPFNCSPWDAPSTNNSLTIGSILLGLYP